ncbi:MAG: MFS transporter [Stellaceae bacterium]
MARQDGTADPSFETDIPARLDRLSWHRFHWLVVTALGVTWILDGLEVTLVGSLSGAFVGTDGLSMSESQVGLAAGAYLAGAIVGALGFGQLTDLYGRKRLFNITVLVYALDRNRLASGVDVGLSAGRDADDRRGGGRGRDRRRRRTPASRRHGRTALDHHLIAHTGRGAAHRVVFAAHASLDNISLSSRHRTALACREKSGAANVGRD